VIDKHKEINKNKSKIIKQAKFLICDSSGKFQNNLDDQDLMLATVPTHVSVVHRISCK
jgi:hypothetical protein